MAQTPNSYNVRCYCVSYAREYVPEVPKLDAEWWDVIFHGSNPSVGSILLLHYPKAWHVAVVTGFSEEGVYVREANFHLCQTSTRLIAWSDPALIKFINFS